MSRKFIREAVTKFLPAQLPWIWCKWFDVNVFQEIPVLEERAGTALEKSNIDNNLRKMQLGNNSGVNTHFGALLRTM